MKTDGSTDRKDIKRQRTMKYFLEAAKEIIENEGVENVTVRKVADMAGYSYPSLYSYFEDLNELLWEVKSFMILSMVEALQKTEVLPVDDIGGIKAVFKAHIAYFLEHPNIFRFFYFHRFQKPGRVHEDALKEPDYGAMWNETFKELVLSGQMKAQDIEVVAKSIIYAIQGMLTLHFSNNGDLHNEGNVYRDLDKIVDYLLAAR